MRNVALAVLHGHPSLARNNLSLQHDYSESEQSDRTSGGLFISMVPFPPSDTYVRYAQFYLLTRRCLTWGLGAGIEEAWQYLGSAVATWSDNRERL